MPNIFNVQKPRDNFAPVPENVVAPMLLRVKRDPASGDFLTQSGSSDARYLNCEITITNGQHKGSKIVVRLVVEGSSAGAMTAQSISYGLIGSMVRSAMGLRSDDMSPQVAAKLTDFNFEDLDGIRFIGKTGRIERGKLRDPSQGQNGDRYDDKATLARGVTPDMEKDWKPWASAPRGFNTGDGLDGVVESSGPRPNDSGDSAVAIDMPPWGDE
jgi:hypothetical protein